MLTDEAEKPAAEWLPVRLADVAPQETREVASAHGCGAIEVDLPRGRVRIQGAADAGMLRLVLELLRS